MKEYERLKIDLAAEGYNSECFDESIPTASKVAREETEEKMIQNLVDRGSTFSASGLFMNTGNMMITSNSLLEASKKMLLDREKDKVEKEQANLAEVQKKIDIGLTAYISFTATHDKPKATDFKNILSALFIMTESEDVISHYKKHSPVYDKN